MSTRAVLDEYRIEYPRDRRSKENATIANTVSNDTVNTVSVSFLFEFYWEWILCIACRRRLSNSERIVYC